MTAPRDQKGHKLESVVSGASTVTNYVFDTAERLASAPVAMVLGVMGGTTGFLVAHGLGATEHLVMLASFLLGASLGVFLSRYTGHAALRRRREEIKAEIDLRGYAARSEISIWKELPPKAPQQLVQEISSEIGRAMTLPDLTMKSISLPVAGRKRDPLPSLTHRSDEADPSSLS